MSGQSRNGPALGFGPSITRRRLLGAGGLVLGLAAASSALAACSGPAETPTPAAAAPTIAQPTAAPPTPPPAPTIAPSPTPPPAPTIAPTSTTAEAAATPAVATQATATPAAKLATSLTVTAKEDGKAYLLEADSLAIAAGTVNVTFKNAGTMIHELWLYPVQDVSKLMSLKRQGKDVDETDYLKAVAGQTGEVEVGKSATLDAKLTPGYYELACYASGHNPDGSTYSHFDKGQTLTIAVVGANGPDPAVTTAGSTLNVQLVPGKGDLASSWLFVPDRLVAKAGDVVFSVTNTMPDTHDFVVYPLGDISAFIADKLKGGENYNLIKAQELIGDAPVGQTTQKTTTLTPGMWVAACFMTGKYPDGSTFIHRDRGQRFTFLVKG
jgi:uncharacterized cupredoxin-like copper-binding protein